MLFKSSSLWNPKYTIFLSLIFFDFFLIREFSKPFLFFMISLYPSGKFQLVIISKIKLFSYLLLSHVSFGIFCSLFLFIIIKFSFLFIILLFIVLFTLSEFCPNKFVLDKVGSFVLLLDCSFFKWFSLFNFSVDVSDIL